MCADYADLLGHTDCTDYTDFFLTTDNTNAVGIAKTLSVVAPAARADKKESESEAAIERIFLDDRLRSALSENKGCFCFEVPLKASFHGSSPKNQLII